MAKVVFVLPALGAGGSERVITAIANHWAERGEDVTLVTFEAAGTPPYFALHPRVDLVQLSLPPRSRPLRRAFSRVAERIAALRRVFRAVEPDVIVSFLTKTNVMTVFAAGGLGVPVIVSERNNPQVQRFNGYWRWARARAYPRAYAFVSMTQRAAAALPKRLRPRERVIPNPVQLPEGWSPRRDGRRIVGVGRLVEQKRFDRLIDAFAIVAPDHPDWTLTIWGEGELLENLKAQRDRLGLRDRVELPGVSKVPGGWVETADIFVLSSRYEGWGVVIVEAMAAGVPVISFDCPFGPAEIIRHGETGALVANGDCEALAAAMADFMSDGNKRETLAEAAKRDVSRFSVDAVAGQWRALIEEAAHARN